MYLILFSCALLSFVYFTSTHAMGFLTDIRKKWNSTPSSSGPDGYGERSLSGSIPRSRKSQHRQRPSGLAAGSESQDSGVVIVPKDSSITLTTVPDNACPNCAANAVRATQSRSNLSHARPSMDRMQSHAGYDSSRPGTAHSGLSPLQSQHNHHTDFSSRPLSWGRRATTEDIARDGPGGYSRPATPPYSIRSEQTGWNSGQQYSSMYQHTPGPASQDGDFSQRPTDWRRRTSSHLIYDSDQRQPRSFAAPSMSSRTPSEAGSAHPRNQSRNMENSAYEAGYRDGNVEADFSHWRVWY